MLRLALVMMMLAAGACGSAETTPTTQPTAAPTTTASTSVAPLATTTTASTAGPVVPALLSDFALDTISLGGAPLLVAVADTPELRRRGLMGIDELGDVAGMLFVFPEETTGGFWMKDTLLALDIAFFGPDGGFVDGFPMEPCTTSSCPTYRPIGAYVYALEVPAGEMPDSPSRLDVSP